MARILTTARKWGIALIGAAAQLVAAGLLPDNLKPWGAVVLALATALGVYAVPNTPKGKS